MTNKEIAAMLYDIADFLKLQDVPYKPRAYQKAADTIVTQGVELKTLYAKCGKSCIDELPGIGESITKKIEEAVQTGQITLHTRLQHKFPFDMHGLTEVEGIGPKKAYQLYKRLGIKTRRDLERAAKAGKIALTKGFGKKTQDHVLEALGFLATSKGRALLGDVLPYANMLVEEVRKIPGVIRSDVTGSIRRRQETIGDIDIVVTTKNVAPVMAAVGRLPQVSRRREQGHRFMAVTYDNNMRGDVLVIDDAVYGAALVHYTGDKYHNIQIRTLAKKKGWMLSEEGLFQGQKLLAGKTEEEVYKKLGLQWMPPELRTGSGEVEAALKGKIPKLIPYGSLKGDLQVQTDWTDGTASIEEMARAAAEVGLEYIAVTDHTKGLAMVGGLGATEIRRQGREIDKTNTKLKSFRILKSAEINILKDGSLDLPDDVLKELDVVSIAVHSHFTLSEGQMTERIIRALKHPLTNILFHPTGRLLKRRQPYPVDIGQIIRAAKQFGVALEASAYPERLDLSDQHIRQAVEAGVKLVVNSDAHAPGHFGFLDLGVAQCRRGWATKADVINTKSCAQFLQALKALKTLKK